MRFWLLVAGYNWLPPVFLTVSAIFIFLRTGGCKDDLIKTARFSRADGLF
jgi:hypothetical protein